LDRARASFEPVKYEPSGDSRREARKDALDQAQADYDAAVRRLEYETAVAQAQANLTRALADLKALADGPDPDQVALLAARLAAAEMAPAGAQARLDQAEARLAQAESQVAQAQAELDLLEVQMAKLTVTAPVDGVILTRFIEPGEVIQPGTAAFTLGELARLTVIVYLPEDRYGAVDLGMAAHVTTDSFPGQTFAASVAYISDQAEFTPRNVQTQDGRKTTVFAVKLQVSDPAGRLKPGMPVDVTFGK
jgi:multidrug efflux pump subunit AcrA (membrane-fusion protein)